MKPNYRFIRIADFDIHIFKKQIKNAYIRFDPFNKHVNVTAPMTMDDEAIIATLHEKLPWLENKQQLHAQNKKQAKLLYVDGEAHYFKGQAHRLKVSETEAVPRVDVSGSCLYMYIAAGMSTQQRKKLLDDFYAAYLKKTLLPLAEKWTSSLNEHVNTITIRDMKTRWGSCSSHNRRITINLKLAKYTVSVLEYVLVHELIHFKQGGHNKRFYDLLSHYLPDWRTRKQQLESGCT